MSEPFVLGVNYLSRHKAKHLWKNLDAGEIREEFVLICELGLSGVPVEPKQQ
jgi:hypothetical protein